MKNQGGSGCVLFFVGGLAMAFVFVFWQQPAVLLAGVIVAWVLMIIAAATVTSARQRESVQLDVSADINNAAFEIRSIFGEKAQREFLDAVSEPSRPGANTNECKFRPGHNRQTMEGKAQEIRGKYRPVEQWRQRY